MDSTHELCIPLISIFATYSLLNHFQLNQIVEFAAVCVKPFRCSLFCSIRHSSCRNFSKAHRLEILANRLYLQDKCTLLLTDVPSVTLNVLQGGETFETLIRNKALEKEEGKEAKKIPYFLYSLLILICLRFPRSL